MTDGPLSCDGLRWIVRNCGEVWSGAGEEVSRGELAAPLSRVDPRAELD